MGDGTVNIPKLVMARTGWQVRQHILALL